MTTNVLSAAGFCAGVPHNTRRGLPARRFGILLESRTTARLSSNIISALFTSGRSSESIRRRSACGVLNQTAIFEFYFARHREPNVAWGSTMNRKSVAIAGAVTLALLAVTLSALTALKVFAAESGLPANQTQQTASRTPNAKWDYRILRSDDTSNLEQGANKLAEQGFELFAFEIVPSFVDSQGATNIQQFVMVFRRARP